MEFIGDGHAGGEHDADGSLDDLFEGPVGPGSAFVRVVGARKIRHVHRHATVEIQQTHEEKLPRESKRAHVLSRWRRVRPQVGSVDKTQVRK